MAVSLTNDEGVMVMAAKNTVSRANGVGSLLASETSENESLVAMPSDVAGAALDVILSESHVSAVLD